MGWCVVTDWTHRCTFHGYERDVKGKQHPDEAMREALQGHIDKFGTPADIALVSVEDAYTPVEGVQFWPVNYMPLGRIYAGDKRSVR